MPWKKPSERLAVVVKRIDDALYELEIMLSSLKSDPTQAAPGIFGRLKRAAIKLEETANELELTQSEVP